MKKECSSSVSLENRNRDGYGTFTPFSELEPLWISNRNLPHWTQDRTSYFITFRLNDSIPEKTALSIKQEREQWLCLHSEPYTRENWIEYNKLFSERINVLLDAGVGSCILREKSISDIVRNSIEHFDGERYKLGKWVVMPNHVHVVLTPVNGYMLDKIMHALKSYTAHEINKKLDRKGVVWQHESYDHVIRSKTQLSFIEDYILNNPIKAGLKVGFQCSSSVSLESS